MHRSSLVGTFLLMSAIAACRDSAETATTTGQGGEDGTGGADTGPTSTASTGTGSAQGGGGGTSTTGPGSGGAGGATTTSTGGGAGGTTGSGGAGGAGGGAPTCESGDQDACTAAWEQAASDRFDEVVAGPPADILPFLATLPKGGDLHNHLSGAVYAETYLDWGRADGDCINTTTYAAVYSNQCSNATAPIPTSGAFYDAIVRAWSMKDFVPGAETGHDHFFATFGKFGAIAGAHRYDSLADLAGRAASENMLYVETMFNLGKNIGQLSADTWSGTLNEADLPGLYDSILNAPSFATELAQDIAVVTSSKQGYRAALGCGGQNPPAACDVDVRFVAQVSRTGAKDTIFGQLISAFEMAKRNPDIVALNLSSPEDDTTSINNYMLHMAMLDFLHDQYDGESPLHVTLHAGELTPEFLPPGSNANTFHIREAIDRGHAERIGHGLDIASEIGSQSILDDMRTRNVMVEICLSSNIQILEVSGPAHPLGLYMDNDVPVALATDDQGVSRSSLAGEYQRAVLDQGLDYHQLKAMARNSLEHAFLPGESLWSSIRDVEVDAACASTSTMGPGDPPNAACEAFLAGSEKARMQWALEGRFRSFESQQ